MRDLTQQHKLLPNKRKVVSLILLAPHRTPEMEKTSMEVGQETRERKLPFPEHFEWCAVALSLSYESNLPAAELNEYLQ